MLLSTEAFALQVALGIYFPLVVVSGTLHVCVFVNVMGCICPAGIFPSASQSIYLKVTKFSNALKFAFFYVKKLAHTKFSAY